MNAAEIKNAAFAELSRGARLNFTDRVVCVKNMKYLFHIIKATEDLLFEAEQKSHGDLREYFTRHLTEENGHADWLKSDLQNEVGRADMLCAAMVGAQYYLVKYVDACALLGYQLVLECFSFPVENLEFLERLHGPELFRTLRHHAMHDVDHGAEVLAQIDKLTAERLPIVFESAVHTARCIAAATHSFTGDA